MGRKPDAWQPPDWAYVGDDGTFNNRFDDPQSRYRVLYASSQKLGCFLETLAPFRVGPTLIAEFAEIEGDNDFQPLGVIDPTWFDVRIMGIGQARGDYAEVGSAEWVSKIRLKLAARFAEFGVNDFDASHVQSPTRSLTQAISRIVYQDERDFEVSIIDLDMVTT